MPIRQNNTGLGQSRSYFASASQAQDFETTTASGRNRIEFFIDLFNRSRATKAVAKRSQFWRGHGFEQNV
ncbi:MAG: hypothetical protein KF867_05490, partial [Cryobacterium sp.]|nr:hypothetical protein [Cryobacterium sp.]